MVAGPNFGVACALASALTWTLIGLVGRALAPYFSALAINLIRSTLGAAMLAPVLVARGGWAPLSRVSTEDWLYLALSVVTAFALGDTAFFASARAIGLGRAMTVSMIHPLIAGTLGVALLGEQVTAAVAAGAVVTLGGLVLIVSERAPVLPEATASRAEGVGLALVAAAAWGVSPVLMKPALRDVDPVSIQAVRLPLAALVLWATPWARGTGQRIRLHLRAAGALLLALGFLTALSAVTFVAALKYAGVTLTAVLSATSPLFALPIGLLAFGERVTWQAVVGASLCLLGIALLSL